MRARLLTLRELVFQTAERTASIGPLDESLKWNEPAYRVRHGGGTTVRIGWGRWGDAGYALHFNCRTTLVDTFRTVFPTELQFAGNRSIVLVSDGRLPRAALAFCISAGFNYRRTPAHSR